MITILNYNRKTFIVQATGYKYLLQANTSSSRNDEWEKSFYKNWHLDARKQARGQLLVLVAVGRRNGLDDDALDTLVLDVGVFEKLQAAAVESLDAVAHFQRDGGLGRAGRVRLETVV